jgi:hypothetical protein
MPTHREAMTNKHLGRLAGLPPNSGHAKVLRAKLGVVDTPPPPPEVVPEPPVTKKKKKKKTKSS